MSTIRTFTPEPSEPWITLEFETVDDSIFVYVCSTIHVTKRYLAVQCSNEFTTSEILRFPEVSRALARFCV
jgi:hypothetical protein